MRGGESILEDGVKHIHIPLPQQTFVAVKSYGDNARKCGFAEYHGILSCLVIRIDS